MTDPTFGDRADLVAWARQRLRYPDPDPGADERAREDVRRVALAHKMPPYVKETNDG